MVKSPDPAPKPDHIRSLRDLAANFVRALDRTALEYEASATADLSERVACLVALHDIEQNDAELAKTPTDVLRSRLNLLRQVSAKLGDYELGYEVRHMTNGELKRRVEYLRQFAAVKDAENLEGFTDEVLEALKMYSTDILRERARIARAKAKAEANVERFPTTEELEDEAA